MRMPCVGHKRRYLLLSISQRVCNYLVKSESACQPFGIDREPEGHFVGRCARGGFQWKEVGGWIWVGISPSTANDDWNTEAATPGNGTHTKSEGKCNGCCVSPRKLSYPENMENTHSESATLMDCASSQIFFLAGRQSLVCSPATTYSDNNSNKFAPLFRLRPDKRPAGGTGTKSWRISMRPATSRLQIERFPMAIRQRRAGYLQPTRILLFIRRAEVFTTRVTHQTITECVHPGEGNVTDQSEE